MLKPAINDLNRDEEMKRFKKSPKDFGCPTTPDDRPADWSPSAGLRNPIAEEKNVSSVPVTKSTPIKEVSKKKKEK